MTVRFLGLGRLRKRGAVCTMNLYSLESMSVRWKGVEEGSFAGSKTRGPINKVDEDEGRWGQTCVFHFVDGGIQRM